MIRKKSRTLLDLVFKHPHHQITSLKSYIVGVQLSDKRRQALGIKNINMPHLFLTGGLDYIRDIDLSAHDA